VKLGTLLLYTDGLVERRDESLQVGLDRLLDVAAGHEGADVDALCDRILAALIESDHVADDIALVVMRPLSSNPS
jgi:serine phosphatase RsbU (regulator of sigma subunit)